MKKFGQKFTKFMIMFYLVISILCIGHMFFYETSYKLINEFSDYNETYYAGSLFTLTENENIVPYHYEDSKFGEILRDWFIRYPILFSRG